MPQEAHAPFVHTLYVHPCPRSTHVLASSGTSTQTGTYSAQTHESATSKKDGVLPLAPQSEVTALYSCEWLLFSFRGHNSMCAPLGLHPSPAAGFASGLLVTFARLGALLP